jgi:hypothetical protein
LTIPTPEAYSSKTRRTVAACSSLIWRTTRSRLPRSAGEGTSTHYACLDSKRRGKAICINRVALRQDLLDRAILGAIGDALDPAVL